MPASPKDKERLLYCSFCGKSQHEVAKLIAGPSVFICENCCDLTGDIILQESDGSGLPLIRERLGGEKARQQSLADMGLRPRFTKLRFREREKHAFLLCPFEEPFNTIYSDHIRPAVESIGFSIDRADEIFGTQPIIEDIWESINSAEVVLADVSGRNPNVMYEVGMAHTVGKPTLIMTQDIEDVPFDLKHHRCVIYSYTPRGCTELQERIKGTLRFLGQRKS